MARLYKAIQYNPDGTEQVLAETPWLSLAKAAIRGAVKTAAGGQTFKVKNQNNRTVYKPHIAGTNEKHYQVWHNGEIVHLSENGKQTFCGEKIDQQGIIWASAPTSPHIPTLTK